MHLIACPWKSDWKAETPPPQPGKTSYAVCWCYSIYVFATSQICSLLEKKSCSWRIGDVYSDKKSLKLIILLTDRDRETQSFSISSQTSDWLKSTSPLLTNTPKYCNKKIQPNEVLVHPNGSKINDSVASSQNKKKRHDFRVDSAEQSRGCGGATLRVLWLLFWLSLVCHSSALFGWRLRIRGFGLSTVGKAAKPFKQTMIYSFLHQLTDFFPQTQVGPFMPHLPSTISLPSAPPFGSLSH